MLLSQGLGEDVVEGAPRSAGDLAKLGDVREPLQKLCVVRVYYRFRIVDCKVLVAVLHRVLTEAIYG